MNFDEEKIKLALEEMSRNVTHVQKQLKDNDEATVAEALANFFYLKYVSTPKEIATTAALLAVLLAKERNEKEIST